MELTRRLKYHLVAFIVVAIWGSTFVFTKLLLLSGLTPAQIFTLRFIIAYVLLLGWTVYREWKKGNHISHLSSLTSHLSSFASRLFCKSWRDELLMAALGVVIVVLNGHFVFHLSPLGDSLAFGAALCWGFYSLLMIPAGQRYDTAFVTRKVFFYGLLSMIPYYMLRPEETWIFTSSVFQFFSSSDTTSIFQFFNSPILLNLLFLGCIASMGCFLAWNWVLKKLGAVVATNYVYFNPVTTILFAWAILSEQITLWFLLGTVLILVGMYLADRKKK